VKLIGELTAKLPHAATSILMSIKDLGLAYQGVDLFAQLLLRY
jgi:hypothetical protein